MTDQELFNSLVEKIFDFFRTIDWGGLITEEFDQWLFDHYPHIRMQCVGDDPMVWFSESRCNPVMDTERRKQFDEIVMLNLAAMEAKRRYYDLIASA